MKLVLDEHYSSEIAVQLRERGHDVVAVTETELVERPDAEVWVWIAREQRALLTENVADFMPFVRQAATSGDHHFGVLFSSPRSWPRSRGTIGRFVDRLDEILHEHPSDDGLIDQTGWL